MQAGRHAKIGYRRGQGFKTNLPTPPHTRLTESESVQIEWYYFCQRTQQPSDEYSPNLQRATCGQAALGPKMRPGVRTATKDLYSKLRKPRLRGLDSPLSSNQLKLHPQVGPLKRQTRLGASESGRGRVKVVKINVCVHTMVD